MPPSASAQRIPFVTAVSTYTSCLLVCLILWLDLGRRTRLFIFRFWNLKSALNPSKAWLAHVLPLLALRSLRKMSSPSKPVKMKPHPRGTSHPRLGGDHVITILHYMHKLQALAVWGSLLLSLLTPGPNKLLPSLGTVTHLTHLKTIIGLFGVTI